MKKNKRNNIKSEMNNDSGGWRALSRIKNNEPAKIGINF